MREGLEYGRGLTTSPSGQRRRNHRSSCRKGLLAALSITLVLVLCSCRLQRALASPDTESLLPNGAGATTECSISGDDANWKCVDDPGAHDGYTTYVYTRPGYSSSRDTYATQNHTIGTGKINSITLHYVATKTGDYITLGANAVIRTHSNVYTGTFYEVTQDWVEYTHSWTANPYTSSEWTWKEIDDLEIGIDLDCGSQETYDVCCTKVWLVIDFTPSPFAFADGGSVTIGTSETTIASRGTPYTSGNNFVLAVVEFQSTANTIILHGNLRLTRGGTTLMSNHYDLKLASTEPDSQKWYVLMDLDTSPGSNPTYDVRATAGATGIKGEAKILVINGASGSKAESAANVSISKTAETELASLSTSLPAGENIVFAICETANQATSARYLSVDSLKRGSTLAGAELNLYHATKAGTGCVQVYLIPYLDTGTPTNPTYTANAKGSTNWDIVGRAKIVAFARGWWYACYADGGSITIPQTQPDTTMTTLATNIPSGSDAIVIASEQFDETAASTQSILNGEDKLQQNDDVTTQTTNEYTLRFPVHGGSDDGKCFALLNDFYPTPSFPTYKVKARANQVPSYMNGEAKILVLGFNSVTPAPEFPYGAFVPLWGIRAPGRRLHGPIRYEESL